MVSIYSKILLSSIFWLVLKKLFEYHSVTIRLFLWKKILTFEKSCKWSYTRFLQKLQLYVYGYQQMDFSNGVCQENLSSVSNLNYLCLKDGLDPPVSWEESPLLALRFLTLEVNSIIPDNKLSIIWDTYTFDLWIILWNQLMFHRSLRYY